MQGITWFRDIYAGSPCCAHLVAMDHLPLGPETVGTVCGTFSFTYSAIFVDSPTEYSPIGNKRKSGGGRSAFCAEIIIYRELPQNIAKCSKTASRKGRASRAPFAGLFWGIWRCTQNVAKWNQTASRKGRASRAPSGNTGEGFRHTRLSKFYYTTRF